MVRSMDRFFKTLWAMPLESECRQFHSLREDVELFESKGQNYVLKTF